VPVKIAQVIPIQSLVVMLPSDKSVEDSSLKVDLSEMFVYEFDTLNCIAMKT
jgi:hypothetical protein